MWPNIFSDLVQLVTLIQIQIHLEIWVITEIALWLSLPRWQLWWIGGCRSLWQWLEWEREVKIKRWRLRLWWVSSWLEVSDLELCFWGLIRRKGSSGNYTDPLSSPDWRVLLKLPKLCAAKSVIAYDLQALTLWDAIWIMNVPIL